MQVSCVYAREIWWGALWHVGLQQLAPMMDDELRPWWFRARSLVPAPLARSLDSLILLVTWNIWKERNRRTFQGTRAPPTELLQLIAQEGDDWLAAGFQSAAACPDQLIAVGVFALVANFSLVIGPLPQPPLFCFSFECVGVLVCWLLAVRAFSKKKRKGNVLSAFYEDGLAIGQPCRSMKQASSHRPVSQSKHPVAYLYCTHHKKVLQSGMNRKHNYDPLMIFNCV